MRFCPSLAMALIAACLLSGPVLAAATRWRPTAARGRSLKQVPAVEPSDTCVTDEGTELVGGDFDLRELDNGSSDQCCTLCSSTPECTSWSFYAEDGLCILKSGAVTSNPNPLASSGMIRGALTSIALPDTALLASAITLDPEASNTTCLTFSTDEADWVLDDGSGKTHGVLANPTLPPEVAVQPLEDQICQDPQAAGPQFAAAIAAGGEQAQLWTYALLDSNCDDPDAATGAYDVAVDSVNPSGDPADMEAVSRWFTNLAVAANSVGIPLCASVALVDAATGTLLEQRDFPTGVQ